MDDAKYEKIGYVALGAASSQPVRTGGCNRRTAKLYETEGRARQATRDKNVVIVPVFVLVPLPLWAP